MVAVFMNCYDRIMRKKSLIETNPYLRDPEQRRKGLIRSVATSTAIETGANAETIARTLRKARKIQLVRRQRG